MGWLPASVGPAMTDKHVKSGRSASTVGAGAPGHRPCREEQGGPRPHSGSGRRHADGHSKSVGAGGGELRRLQGRASAGLGPNAREHPGPSTLSPGLLFPHPWPCGTLLGPGVCLASALPLCSVSPWLGIREGRPWCCDGLCHKGRGQHGASVPTSAPQGCNHVQGPSFPAPHPRPGAGCRWAVSAGRGTVEPASHPLKRVSPVPRLLGDSTPSVGCVPQPTAPAPGEVPGFCTGACSQKSRWGVQCVGAPTVRGRYQHQLTPGQCCAHLCSSLGVSWLLCVLPEATGLLAAGMLCGNKRVCNECASSCLASASPTLVRPARPVLAGLPKSGPV